MELEKGDKIKRLKVSENRNNFLLLYGYAKILNIW